MLRDLWKQIKESLLGKEYLEKPKFHVYVEATKPDPNYVPPPKKPKLPKPPPKQSALICPHCQYLFEKVSGSKRRCPQCKGEIIVRTDNRVKLLFTPEGAERFDADRQRRYNRNNLIREYVGWVDGGIFDEQKAVLKTTTNRTLSDEEFTLHLLNEQLESKESQDDLWLQRQLYFTIARLQNQMGLDPYDAKAAFFRCDLLHSAQQFGHDSKVRVHTGCKCDDCGKVDGKVMSIQEALVRMPLPVRGCEMEIFARYDGYIGD